MIAQRQRSRLSFTAYSGHGKTGQARETQVNNVLQFLLTTTLTISAFDFHSVPPLRSWDLSRNKRAILNWADDVIPLGKGF